MSENTKEHGNESFGIPKDYTQKQRFSALKLFVYIFIVVIVCIGGYKGYRAAIHHFLPTVTFDKTQQPIIYQRINDITLKTAKGDSFTAGSLHDTDSVKPIQKGTAVFFISKDGELCASQLASDKETESETVVIDSGVSDFKTNSDGAFVAYRKQSQLFVSNLKVSRLLASDISEYYLSKNNQKVIFIKNDNSIYTCGTVKGETPVLVDNNVEKIISEKNDYSAIYYIKNSNLYKKEYDGPRILMAEGVLDAIMLGESVYFTTYEEYEKRFTDIFYDDKANSDAKLKYPKTDDFMDVERGTSLFDAEGYREALAEYENKLMRDSVREYYQGNPAKVYGYSLYLYGREQSTRVDMYLQSPTLSYNASHQVILYKRFDTNIYRPKTSKLKGFSDALSAIEVSLSTPMDTDIHLLKRGRLPYKAFEEPPENQVIISLDSAYIYCLENFRDGFATLVRYEIGNKSLRARTKICENVSDFYVDGTDSATVIVFSGDRLGIFTQEKYTHLSDRSYRDFFFVDGAFFYYDDYDYTEKTGTLKTFRNNKSSVIDNGVKEFDVRNYNTVSYIKNYNPDMGVGNLYVKSGRIKKKEDICVAAILN